MAIQLSPGVRITETDLTNVVPAVATTSVGFAGHFQWGPVDEVVTVSSENELVSLFGAPTDDNFIDFFSAANVLAYGNNLKLARVVGSSAANASATGSAPLVKNEDQYEDQISGLTSVGPFFAKYPGNLGNSLSVSWITTGEGGTSDFATWAYQNSFDRAPGSSDWSVTRLGTTANYDEMHVVVIDEDGLWTGQKGAILERFEAVSLITDAKAGDGTSLYWKDVINDQSRYVWAGNDAVDSDTGVTGSGFTSSNASAWSVGNSGSGTPAVASFVGGTGEYSGNVVQESLGATDSGYNLFKDTESQDISFLIAGGATGAEAQEIIDIAQARLDCVAFVSPERSDVVNRPASEATQNVVDYRNNTLARSTSYAVMDSGWKYQYDQYNDKYRWVPLNPDVAGCCIRTDLQNDPWFSPAGLNRGNILNAVKLAFNPNKTQRDELYKNGVNPIISKDGQGIILFGDKTLQGKASAFDRINVRRLFIVLEKAIAQAADSFLFEFNNAQTRSLFTSLIEPFLRDVQGRQGLTAFRVVCDESNNTQQVIDTNRLVCDVYIQPARSVNFIRLNFVAQRTGANFTEVQTNLN